MTDPENPYASPSPVSDPPSSIRLLEGPIDASEAIFTEGTVTEEDFRNARRLQRGSGLLVFVIFAIGVAFFAGGGMRLLVGRDPMAALIVTVLVGGAVALSILMPRIAAGKMWRRAVSLHVPFRRVITPEVIQTITPDSHVILRWSSYFSYRRSEKVVILNLALHPKLYTIVPRHTFQSDEDWLRFLGLVEANLPRG